MAQRRAKLEDELGKLRFEDEDLERRRAALVTHAAELAEGKRISADERTRLDAEMKELREATVLSDKSVDHAKNELNQRRSRLRALEELHARLEGVGTGVKNLLKTKDPALLGLVADRIEAPAELTQAFAGLLGDRIQCVVVSDVERGVALLGDLAKGKNGRASVISRSPRYVAGAAAAPLHGRASSAASSIASSSRPRTRRWPASLVGDAVVVETAAIALRLSAEGAATALVAL